MRAATTPSGSERPQVSAACDAHLLGSPACKAAGLRAGIWLHHMAACWGALGSLTHKGIALSVLDLDQPNNTLPEISLALNTREEVWQLQSRVFITLDTVFIDLQHAANQTGKQG